MERNKQIVRSLLGVVAFGVVLTWGLFRPGELWSVIELGLSLMRPFVIGLLVAFIVNLLLRPVERLWERLARRRGAAEATWVHRFKRPVGIFVSVGLIVVAFVVLLFIVLPEVIGTILHVADEMPAYSAQLEAWRGQLAAWLETYGVTLPSFDVDVAALGPTVSEWLTERGPAFLGQALGFTTSLFTGVFNLVVGFVFALYVLAEKERLGRQVRRVLFAFLPQNKAQEVVDVATLANSTFAKYVTGQLTDAFIVGVLCYIGMLVLALPHPGAVSVLVGATTIVPIIGVLMGTVVGALLILVVDPMKALWFILFIIVLQQLESNYIYPKVVGKSVGLPSIWVLAAIILGGATFGVVGMLVAVPIFSVLYTVLRRSVQRRLTGRGEGAR